jgi:hypothetical protein
MDPCRFHKRWKLGELVVTSKVPRPPPPRAPVTESLLQVYAWSMLEAESAGKPPPPLSSAFTHEICAGIIDKEKSLEEITAEEVPPSPIPYPPHHTSQTPPLRGKATISGSVYLKILHHPFPPPPPPGGMGEEGSPLQVRVCAVHARLPPHHPFHTFPPPTPPPKPPTPGKASIGGCISTVLVGN